MRVHLFYLFALFASLLQGQNDCFVHSPNLSGIIRTTGGIDSLSCVLAQTVSSFTGTQDFKTYSVANYSTAGLKNEGDIERYRVSAFDSISNVSPYRLIFWWEHFDEGASRHCRVSLTFSGAEELDNCFSDLRIGLIEHSLQLEMNSIVGAESFEGGIIEAEYSILHKALNEIQAIISCCASQDEKSRCDGCVSNQELASLKKHYYLYRMYGPISLSSSHSSDKPTGDVSRATRSNGNYSAYVNDILQFGNYTIDLYAEYQKFIAVGDTICDFPVTITNDEVLCSIDLTGWDNADRTIINLALDENGGSHFELSEYTYDNCYLFFDYLNDKYPEVFGPRYIEEHYLEDELFEVGGRGVIDSVRENTGKN